MIRLVFLCLLLLAFSATSAPADPPVTVADVVNKIEKEIRRQEDEALGKVIVAVEAELFASLTYRQRYLDLQEHEGLTGGLTRTVREEMIKGGKADPKLHPWRHPLLVKRAAYAVYYNNPKITDNLLELIVKPEAPKKGLTFYP